MLEHHTPTCNRKPVGSAASDPVGGGQAAIYKHKTGDDEDDDDEQSRDADDSISTNLQAAAVTGNMKIKLPEVACTICGARFTDQELFAKHIQMHERELYTDNPLAAMFDTGPADPNQFYMDRVNDNGEYACDLCSKTFTQMTAFKVHRKWHFRGDNKQVSFWTCAVRLRSEQKRTIEQECATYVSTKCPQVRAKNTCLESNSFRLTSSKNKILNTFLLTIIYLHSLYMPNT